MARPKKARVICSTPKYRLFAPIVDTKDEKILLEADEYEVLRLHDLEHMSQADVASQMLVSRPTVTMLLNSAHQKIADALVNGKSIEVIDGDCRVCEIGCTCPSNRKDSCEKRARCAASCRIAQQNKSNH